MNLTRLALQILLPVAVLGGAALLAAYIISQRKDPVVAANDFVGPMVNEHRIELAQTRIDVRTQGTVEPFRAIDLAAQVSGRVVAVSPALRAGGFFAKGEVLVQIEDTDFALARVQQEAAIARAELHLLQETEEAEASMRAWRELEGERPAGPLVTREAQVREAEQALAAAKAQHERCRLDLERTMIRAPFAGRVHKAQVDVGQVVQPGAPLARIYGTEFAEVRLPLPVQDAAFVDLPLRWSDNDDATAGPQVELTGTFGNREFVYHGIVVRTEGEVDRKTRQLTVVARVEAPYAQDPGGDRPPLAIGSFVQASIHGRNFQGIAVVPRSALHGSDEVWLIDAENKLRRRRIEVLHADRDRIYVSSGLADGEVLCTTPLDTPVDGMPVQRHTEQHHGD